MANEITMNAARKLKRFNSTGLHYNLVADQIYKKRFTTDFEPFGDNFLRYIIAGLITFDIGRMMGKEPYSTEYNHFGSRLKKKIITIKPLIEDLMDMNLFSISLAQYETKIIDAYERLYKNRDEALADKNFHVGATKILHFLNPNLFIIIDSNAAKAFRKAHNIPFIQSTQPGYSAERYMKCLKCAQKDIVSYGIEDFQALDKGTPIARIYDKLTFVTGQEISNKSFMLS